MEAQTELLGKMEQLIDLYKCALNVSLVSGKGGLLGAQP